MEQEFASRLLEDAVTEMSRLPGIGRKTALRLALHILRQEPQMAHSLGNALMKLRDGVVYCRKCHNISESEICGICADPRRDSSTVCVVENVKDVMSFENTGSYHGLYHVLGGVISPMDGVGPEKLEISSLIDRIGKEDIKEVILALSATMEGDTTNFYIYRRLAETGVKITQIARGVSVGNEIEFTDEVTLGRSLLNRTLFSDQFQS
ncbi:MAG: recombination mediator RecR [Muribaculaceae bacterium]|nr:recombination mediator RecR [Muribaculaceae bacterium]